MASVNGLMKRFKQWGKKKRETANDVIIFTLLWQRVNNDVIILHYYGNE